MAKEIQARLISSMIVCLLFSTALLVFISGTVMADTGSDPVSLSGRVVDSNGNGLAGISVALESGSPVTTDAQGNFVIMCSPGVHDLTVSGSGIRTVIMPVNVGESGLSMGTIETSSATPDTIASSAMIIAGLLVTALVIVLIVVLFMRRRKKQASP